MIGYEKGREAFRAIDEALWDSVANGGEGYGAEGSIRALQKGVVLIKAYTDKQSEAIAAMLRDKQLANHLAGPSTGGPSKPEQGGDIHSDKRGDDSPDNSNYPLEYRHQFTTAGLIGYTACIVIGCVVGWCIGLWLGA